MMIKKTEICVGSALRTPVHRGPADKNSEERDASEKRNEACSGLFLQIE